jgi:hypothetical protein
MIMATAGAATSAAWTASKVPEVAGPGVGADCPLPVVGRVAGLALAAVPCGVELEDEGIEIEGVQAPASSTPLKPESKRRMAGLAVAFRDCMDCGPHGRAEHVKES